MPVFELSEELVFPPPQLAIREGILAVGGDLSVERLLLAYQSGIFPWFSPEDPIIWWSPNPRFVLYPSDLLVSKSMRQVLRKGVFRITFDQAFEQVIHHCRKTPRRGQGGTWITADMEQAYRNLHHLGYAHSVEVWQDDQLAGGLYGVSLGSCYFGESMFSLVSNASKAGFITLMRQLQTHNFTLIDCQVYTDHLATFGAREIPRKQFLADLRRALEAPTLRGDWGELMR